MDPPFGNTVFPSKCFVQLYFAHPKFVPKTLWIPHNAVVPTIQSNLSWKILVSGKLSAPPGHWFDLC